MPESEPQHQSDAAPVCLAEVAIDRPGRDAYSYLVPDELADRVVAGACVEVPFGPRRERAFVLNVAMQPPPPGVRLKAVGAVIDGVVVPVHVLRLVRWASGYYRCSIGEFLAAAVPAAVREGRSIKQEVLIARAPDFAGSLTKRQQEVLDQVPATATAITELCRLVGCTRGVIERLEAAGAVTREKVGELLEVRMEARDERFEPTPQQAKALAAVGDALDAARHEVFLLYGVTGSGKTLVYLELAERVIAAGAGVLVLLPEIGLTPQLAARFRKRFPDVVVWHSGFTAGERAELWRRIAAGDAPLVLGTRSALFAPLPRIGLVVVDEEHDQSYKQDSTPRYHGRDLAVVYARQLGIPAVLGSGTPSLESYHNARAGRYTALTMTSRPAGGQLPEPTVIDMAAVAQREGRFQPVTPELLEALRETHERGEQAIVLLNRRGWSPVISCLSCGASIECKSCDISLTWHRGPGQLRCHYCGHEEPMPSACPSCGQPTLDSKGMGTEQLAAVLGERIPGLRVLRLDADTVATRQGHAGVLKRFAEGAADCLVGTQMVAKGFDFPRVTLVGIVGADSGLSVPDFRAAERTYQLVAQVAGRAGRGERPGKVLVQAFDVEHPALVCALRRQPKTFYTRELQMREDYGYPPHAGLVRVLWRGPDESKVQAQAEAHGERLRAAAGDLPVLGPNPAGLAFLKGQHRWHALVKAGSRGAAQQFLDRLQTAGGLPERGGVKVALDVDPYQIT